MYVGHQHDKKRDDDDDDDGNPFTFVTGAFCAALSRLRFYFFGWAGFVTPGYLLAYAYESCIITFAYYR